MPTSYKPSEWRDKRQVYRSTDPNEPGRGKPVAIVALIIVILCGAVFWISTLK